MAAAAFDLSGETALVAGACDGPGPRVRTWARRRRRRDDVRSRDAAMRAIRRLLDRRERAHDPPPAYVAYVRARVFVPRSNAYRERAYEHEWTGDRVRSRTRRVPVSQDIVYGRKHDARRPVSGRTGRVATATDLQNFARIAPRATAVMIEARRILTTS